MSKTPVLLVLLGLAGVYGGAELVVRRLFPLDAGDAVQDNPLTHHDYIPGVDFVRQPSRWDTFKTVRSHVNSYGIRGPELGPKKSPRLLVIGDSFIQANQVVFKDSFPQLLDRHFAGRREVISHGIGGWTPTPEFSWIYHKGLPLQPEEIDLLLSDHVFERPDVTFYNDAAYRAEAVYDNGVPVHYPQREPKGGRFKPLRDFLKKSRLLQMASSIVRMARSLKRGAATAEGPSLYAREALLFAEDFDRWPEDLRRNVDAAIDVVVALNDYLKARGVKLNVMLAPLGIEYAGESVAGKKRTYGWPAEKLVSQSGLQRHLIARLREKNIPFIDLEAGFAAREKAGAGPLFNEMDPHWTVKGHRAVYEILADYHDGAVAPRTESR